MRPFQVCPCYYFFFFFCRPGVCLGVDRVWPWPEYMIDILSLSLSLWHTPHTACRNIHPAMNFKQNDGDNKSNKPTRTNDLSWSTASSRRFPVAVVRESCLCPPSAARTSPRGHPCTTAIRTVTHRIPITPTPILNPITLINLTIALVDLHHHLHHGQALITPIPKAIGDPRTCSRTRGR